MKVGWKCQAAVHYGEADWAAQRKMRERESKILIKRGRVYFPERGAKRRAANRVGLLAYSTERICIGHEAC